MTEPALLWKEFDWCGLDCLYVLVRCPKCRGEIRVSLASVSDDGRIDPMVCPYTRCARQFGARLLNFRDGPPIGEIPF